MKCSRCGAVNSDGNTFCKECGIVLDYSTEMEEEVKTINANEGNENQALSKRVRYEEGDEELDENGDYDTDDMMDFSTELSEGDRMAEEFTKKESKYHALENSPSSVTGDSDIIYSADSKKKVIIITAVIALVAAALLIYLFLPTITKTFMEPQKYYAVMEAKHIKAANKSSSELLAKLFNASYNIKSEINMVSRGDSEEKDNPSIAGLKYSLNQIADSKNERYKTEFAIIDKEHENHIFNLTVLEKDGKSVYSLGDLVDGEFVGASYRWMSGILSQSDSEIEEMTGLSKGEFKKLSKDLLDRIVLSSFSEDNILEYDEELNGQQYSAASFTINKSVKQNIHLALLAELEANQQLRAVIVNMAGYYDEKLADTYGVYQIERKPLTEEELHSVPDLLVERLREDADEFVDDTVYKYVVFYTKGLKKEIAARRIESTDGFYLTVSSYDEKDEQVYKISYLDSAAGTNFLIENRSRERGANVVGAVTFTAVTTMPVTPLTIDYTIEKDAAIAGTPVFVGEIKMKMAIDAFSKQGPANFLMLNLAAARVEENSIKTLVDIVNTKDGVELLSQGFEIMSVYSSDYTIEDFDIPEKSTLTQKDMTKASQMLTERLMEAVEK